MAHFWNLLAGRRCLHHALFCAGNSGFLRFLRLNPGSTHKTQVIYAGIASVRYVNTGLEKPISPMLQTCSRIIALTAVVACLSMIAQAADETLTLACKGTATDATQTDAKPEPHSMGIIVNFTARSVAGFTYPGFDDFPVKISAVNDVTIAFDGSNSNGSWTISGSIDRVTGDVDATSIVMNLKTRDVVSATGYALKCRPTQRMF
jgi:hypothetical protein